MQELFKLTCRFQTRGIRLRDEAEAIKPGEFRDVDAPGGNIRDAFMPLPFKEPSGTLLNLMVSWYKQDKDLRP